MARRTSKAESAQQIAARYRELRDIYQAPGELARRPTAHAILREAFLDVVGHRAAKKKDEQLLDEAWQLTEGPLLTPNVYTGGSFENPPEVRYWHAVDEAARGKLSVERFIPGLDQATWCLRWSHAANQPAYIRPTATVTDFVVAMAVHVMHQDVIAWRGGDKVRVPDGVPRPRPLSYEDYWDGVEMIAKYATQRRASSEDELGDAVMRLVQSHPFTPFGQHAKRPEYTMRAYDVLRHSSHIEALDGYLFQPGMPPSFEEVNRELARTDTVLGMSNAIAQGALVGDVWWRVGGMGGRFVPNASCCDDIGESP